MIFLFYENVYHSLAFLSPDDFTAHSFPFGKLSPKYFLLIVLCVSLFVSVYLSLSLSLSPAPFPLPSVWNHNQSFLLIPKQLLKPKSVRLGSSFPISLLVLSLMSQKAQIWGKTGYIWRNNLVFPHPFYSPIHIQVWFHILGWKKHESSENSE